MKKVTFVVVMFLGLFVVSNILSATTNAEYDKAIKYYNSKKYKEAVALLKEYVKKNPSPSIYYRIGYALYKLGKYEEANEYFKEAYFIDPAFAPDVVAPVKKEPAVKPQEAAKPPAEQASQKPPVAESKAAKVEPTPAKQPSKETQPKKPETVKAAPLTPVEKKPSVPETKKAEPQKAAPQKPEPAAVPEKKTPATEPQKAQPPAGIRSEEVKAMTKIAVIVTAFLAGFAGLFAGFFLIFVLIGIAFYIFYSLCLFLIAKKLNVPLPWLAWIPLVKVWVIVGSAGKPWWWVLLFLIPIINVGIFVYLWMCITENLGKNKWLGLLILVPVVNFVWMGILAFSKSEKPGGTTPIDETLTLEKSSVSEEKPPEEEF